MARTSLAQLLPAEPPMAAVPDPQAEVAATPPPARRSPTRSQQEEKPLVTSATSEVEGQTGPRYLRLERKEARLRLDQADALAQLTRRLNRARGRNGERITDNTLIRVAVDLLLAEADHLAGATESELRESVSR